MDKSIRQLERERAGLEKQEQLLIADIRKSAKTGNRVRRQRRVT